MAEFYFRAMTMNLPKTLRAVFARILFPLAIVTLLFISSGDTTFAQSASNTPGAWPATYDQWKEQNAKNEKGNESVQTFAIVAVVVVVGLGFFRRWYMRN